MARNGIDIAVNASDRYILFTFRGILNGRQMLDATTAAYAGLSKPWLYNRVYDLRAFINVVSLEDLQAQIKQWEGIVGRRHAPMRFGIVTDDPVRMGRAKAYGPLFPHLDVEVFPSVEEAIAWLKTEATPLASERTRILLSGGGGGGGGGNGRRKPAPVK